MTQKLVRLVPTPLGSLEIEAEGDHISSIRFLMSGERISESSSASKILDKCTSQLLQYFEGSRRSFTIPIKPAGTDFENLVWEELCKIPFGATISYEVLAIRLGNVQKIRAAARANGKNPIPIMIPCHRVIGKDGSLVGFSGGLKRKEWLLSHEGAIGKQSSIF